MQREPIPTWFFVLLVVKKENKYLLVREAKFNQAWFFPAGKVELGEDFITAAKREVLEEAGVDVEVEKIIKIEHTPYEDQSTVRLFLLASQIGDAPPKSVPDDESLEAQWFTLEQIRQLPLRKEAVFEIITTVDNGVYMANIGILENKTPQS